MRASLLVALAGLALAQAPQPQKVVFSRVFPQPGQIGLFIAAADGSNEHPLVAPADVDYDAAWAPDGASIVFTSERNGSADLYRVKPDGSGLERLTDSPAYDDQAALSPDGKQLVFVSTRAGGTANLWTMDLQTRRARPLTSGPGGDFRPSWSPDGQWIAFASGRTSDLPFGHGRWEHLQLADLYVVHPDGSSLKHLTTGARPSACPPFSLRPLLAAGEHPMRAIDCRRFGRRQVIQEGLGGLGILRMRGHESHKSGRSRNLPWQGTDNIDARLDHFAQERHVEIDVALGDQRDRAGAAPDLRLHLPGDPELLEGLIEADPGGRAPRRSRIVDRVRRKQHPFDCFGRREIGLRSTLLYGDPYGSAR
jgi:hypothetical protein